MFCPFSGSECQEDCALCNGGMCAFQLLSDNLSTVARMQSLQMRKVTAEMEAIPIEQQAEGKRRGA